MQPRLRKISPNILASDKKVGGAMMRLNRDVRFSKGQARRTARASARASCTAKSKKGGTPGYFIRIESLQAAHWAPASGSPDTKFVGEHPRPHREGADKAWKSATGAKAFRAAFGELAGESLKRPPRGYDADHQVRRGSQAQGLRRAFASGRRPR